MATWGRLKAFGGGSTRSIPTVASATAITIPLTSDTVLISGTATIGTINATGAITPGHRVTLLFLAAASVTDTAYSTSAAKGTVFTTNPTIAAGTSLTIIQDNNGCWWQVATSVNG